MKMTKAVKKAKKNSLTRRTPRMSMSMSWRS
jgi:hypothetical protein